MVKQLSIIHRAFATFSRSPRVAVVGSGPAGLYVCSGLLRRMPTCEIDVFDASPVPFGLIRYGVAPDHPEVKNCINQFDRMFNENRDRLSLYCNVSIGKDLKYEELLVDYDALVLAYGARKQNRLSIPGIHSKNCISGGDFVAWYNAAPGARSPLLDCEDAVIIGNGNVALDCCRILLSSACDRLARTDIPTNILEELARSRIRQVTIIGRRGPLEVSFTIKELREQINLPGCSFAAEVSESDVRAVAEKLPSLPRPRKRITELLMKNLNKGAPKGDRHCQLLFRRNPIEVIPDKNERVSAVVLKHSETGGTEEIPCGLLIYSIGFKNVVLEGVPKDENGSIKMLDDMRVAECKEGGNAIVFACGWCAHSPRGVIADTQVASASVAAAVCKDLELLGTRKDLKNCAFERLQARGVKFRSWDDWKRIDEEEKNLGKRRGKEREKVINFERCGGVS